PVDSTPGDRLHGQWQTQCRRIATTSSATQESRSPMADAERLKNETRERREMGRLEAFSDGVFAIAITLLILQIPIPAHSPRLLHDVLQSWPSFLTYAIIFVVILIMWINHHTAFRLIGRIDRRFLILNGLLL